MDIYDHNHHSHDYLWHNLGHYSNNAEQAVFILCCHFLLSFFKNSLPKNPFYILRIIHHYGCNIKLKQDLMKPRVMKPLDGDSSLEEEHGALETSTPERKTVSRSFFFFFYLVSHISLSPVKGRTQSALTLMVRLTADNLNTSFPISSLLQRSSNRTTIQQFLWASCTRPSELRTVSALAVKMSPIIC